MSALTFKKGDKVVFCKHKANKDSQDITVGKVYEVYEDDAGAYFQDDAGDARHYPLESGTTYKPTKIVE